MAFLQSLHTSMALCRVMGSPPAALTTSLHSSIANPPCLKRLSFLANTLKETIQLIHSPEYESISASISESEQILLDHFQLLDRIDEIPVSRTQHRHQSSVGQLTTNCTNQTCNSQTYGWGESPESEGAADFESIRPSLHSCFGRFHTVHANLQIQHS
ncbi:hypothetical protein WR25_02274 [Diploscapter pachys]|uniref:Uncharacterized protein n=1 Tax=Diploscapter pachys TaxID=2018661 RepID=A0A2A2JGK3_9BILA|nr:hypothetical protein WR25_02274 [Diploscapter pachys]